jgi:hypothetical protein
VGRGPASQAPRDASESLSARRAGLAAIAGYLLTIAIFEITRRAAGFPEPSDVALTPAALAAGRVWLLLTSALLVSGPPLLELLGLGLAIGILVRREGPLSFWRAGFAAHLGATLSAYAGVGLLWIASHPTVAPLVHDPDYGVSAVWLGVLGTLFASIWSERRAQPIGALNRVALVLCAAAALIGTVFFEPLQAVEHALAFLIGAGVQAVATKPRVTPRARAAAATVP